MGNAQSQQVEQEQQVQKCVEDAEKCKMHKATFNEMMNIITDTHSIMQFYASSLLMLKAPSRFASYKTFNSESENMFNRLRNTPTSGISSISNTNASFNTYYDVYNYVKDFKNVYEKATVEDERRVLLGEIFNVTYGTMKVLLREVTEACV